MNKSWKSKGPPPHGGQAVLVAGEAIESGRAVVVLVHGRGASAADILGLGRQIASPGRVVLVAPQAAGGTWYPYSFLAPLPNNEPGLSSGLAVLAAILDQLAAAGLPPERVVLGGFSQGACLATEFAARHARRYGGIVGLSGGLIGPPGTPRAYPGSLNGTPVFLGCSTPDPHIPTERVIETADVLRHLGGQVTMRLYPNLGHTVNDEEIAFVRDLVSELASLGPARRTVGQEAKK